MNGEDQGLEVVGEALNQPGIQENYPMDFTGYMYEEPSVEAPPVVEAPLEVSPAQRIQAWSQTPEGKSEEPASSNDLVTLFGNVLNVAGKTYQQIATQKEVQNLKSTPYVNSALNALGYPTVRKAQTGVDTGMLTSSLTTVKKALSSISPMILILGVGILAFFVIGKK